LYNVIGNQYLVRALQLSEKVSAEFLFLKAWEYMRVRNIEQAIRTYQKLLHEYGLTEHEYAIVTSSLSFMYLLDNNQAKTKEYLTKAVMADIRASVLETVALRDWRKYYTRKANTKELTAILKLPTTMLRLWSKISEKCR